MTSPELKETDVVSNASKEGKNGYDMFSQKAKIPDYIGQTFLSILVFIMGAVSYTHLTLPTKRIV